jgi:hypothetical protein
MSTLKPKAKVIQAQAASPKEDLARATRVQTTQQKQFSAVVGSIAERYGVKVASAAVSTENPYSMSPEQSAEVALQAGIITRTGMLKPTFK